MAEREREKEQLHYINCYKGEGKRWKWMEDIKIERGRGGGDKSKWEARAAEKVLIGCVGKREGVIGCEGGQH